MTIPPPRVGGLLTLHSPTRRGGVLSHERRQVGDRAHIAPLRGRARLQCHGPCFHLPASDRAGRRPFSLHQQRQLVPLGRDPDVRRGSRVRRCLPRPHSPPQSRPPLARGTGWTWSSAMARHRLLTSLPTIRRGSDTNRPAQGSPTARPADRRGRPQMLVCCRGVEAGSDQFAGPVDMRPGVGANSSVMQRVESSSRGVSQEYRSQRSACHPGLSYGPRYRSPLKWMT